MPSTIGQGQSWLSLGVATTGAGAGTGARAVAGTAPRAGVRTARAAPLAGARGRATPRSRTLSFAALIAIASEVPLRFRRRDFYAFPRATGRPAPAMPPATNASTNRTTAAILLAAGLSTRMRA